MPVKLNKTTYTFAQELIKEGRFVYDERDAWSEHQPSTQDENAFIKTHGSQEYAKSFLAVDDDVDANSKRHYKFPYATSQKDTVAEC